MSEEQNNSETDEMTEVQEEHSMENLGEGSPSEANDEPSGEMPEKWKKLKHLLDHHEEFPLNYCFKFIVKSEQITELTELFPDYEIETRESKNGNYKSVTFNVVVESSDTVIEVYQRASAVSGVITL